ncbi:MAG: hypothetical protein ACLPVF_14720 [Acidimicrobiales bacterium]
MPEVKADGAVRGSPAESPGWSGGVRVFLAAVLPRPWLWWSGLSAVARLSRRGWWHHPPFLPLPGEAYWHFRLVTAFGRSGASTDLTKRDVVGYLQWCRRAHPRRG